MSDVTYTYQTVRNARPLNQTRALEVIVGNPSGFECTGPRCKRHRRHSAFYFEPQHQPNQPLIGLRVSAFPLSFEDLLTGVARPNKFSLQLDGHIVPI